MYTNKLVFLTLLFISEIKKRLSQKLFSDRLAAVKPDWQSLSDLYLNYRYSSQLLIAISFLSTLQIA